MADTKKGTVVMGTTNHLSAKTIVGNTTACPPVVIESKKIILLAYGAVIKSICLQTGNLLATYYGHRDIVTHIVDHKNYWPANIRKMANNDTIIISTSIDGIVHMWNLNSLETLHTQDLGSPILRVLLLPRLKENKEIVEEKDSLVVKSEEEVFDAYFVLHPEKNSKDPLHQNFQVKIYDSKRFQPIMDAPVLTTTSPLVESISFNLKSNDLIGTTGQTALITLENKQLVFNILTRSLYGNKMKRVEVGLQTESIAVNNLTGTLAVGTQYGEIVLFRNVSDYLRFFYFNSAKTIAEKDLFDSIVVKSKLIWHSHGVKSLAFSSDGRILYSGGEESVLTMWNLNKSLKSFIPRVGGPISHLVSFQDATQTGKILLSLADNGLKLVNTANVDVEWSWQALYIAQSPLATFSNNIVPIHHHKGTGEESNSDNNNNNNSGASQSNKWKARELLLQSYVYPYIYFDQPSEKYWKPKLEVDQLHHQVIVSGNLGSLQFFDINTAVVNKKLNVVNFLRVSRKDNPRNLFVPTLLHYKLSKNGQILVTVDAKKMEEMNLEYSLKFWLVNNTSSISTPSGSNANGEESNAPAATSSSSSFELIAQMNAPHHDLAITDLSLVADGTMEDSSLLGLVATASGDGTVKVWRGTYESYRNIIRGKDSNERNQEVKTSKFIWKCFYSFQYRQTPIYALTWSNDASMLCIAYDNMITFWNPQTVTMKDSITDEMRIKIRYMYIVEPRARPECGGGCGDVYLVVGSVSVVRVYSLVTFKLLWSYQNRFINAVAVANDEREILTKNKNPSQSRISTTIAEEGWIAIATSTMKFVSAEETDEIPVNPAPPTAAATAVPSTNKKNSKKSNKQADEEVIPAAVPVIEKKQPPQQQQLLNELLLFSPLSAEPIYHQVISQKIISLSFLRPIESSSSTSSTATNNVPELIALTSDSELLSFKTVAHEEFSSHHPLKVASVKKAVLPVMISKVLSPEEEVEEGSAVVVDGDISKVLAPGMIAATSKATTNKNWLNELIPEHTEDLPKPSDFTLDFLKAIASTNASGSSNNKKTKNNSTIKNDNHTKNDDDNNKKIAKNNESTKNNKSAVVAVSATQRKIDLDQITSMLEKKTPFLGKRSFQETQSTTEESKSKPQQQQQATTPAAPVSEKKKAKTSHASESQPSEKDAEESVPEPVPVVATKEKEANNNKKEKSSKKKDSKEKVVQSVEESVEEEEEVSPPAAAATPAITPTPDENRRKTRRMTRSESELSESQIPTSLVKELLQEKKEVVAQESTLTTKTPSKSKSAQKRKKSEESETEDETPVSVVTEEPVSAANKKRNTGSGKSKEVAMEPIPEESEPRRSSRRKN